MRIPSPVKTDLDYEAYCDSLLKMGYSFLNSGTFARVYSKPSENTVIKVGVNYPTITRPRDAYLAFLKASVKTNPHFPRVGNITRFTPSNGREYYAVQMERLIPFNSIQRDVAMRSLEKLGVVGDEKYGVLTPLMPLEFTPKTYHMKYMKKVLKQLFQEHNEDLHCNNVMWRKRGKSYQFVITDPVA